MTEKQKSEITADISQRGAKTTQMNQVWNNEFQYQLTMSLVRQIKTNGIISENEYEKIDTIMLKKYRPVLGTLLSGNSLN